MKSEELHKQIRDILEWVMLNTEFSNQTKIADEIGVNKATVSSAFNGHKRAVTLSFLNRLREAFPECPYAAYGSFIETPPLINESAGTYNKTSSRVPYWDLPVSAGKSIVDVIGATKPSGYIEGLPGAHLAENILPVDGASMEPEVFPNALIGVRKMNNWETLNTERVYLIITMDDRMIKRIAHDKDDPEILWCLSPNYPEFKIYKSEIIEIQRVCFVYNPK